MADRVAFTSGRARLELVPVFGGGIASLEVDGRPVLRPWNGDTSDPFTLASNVLVPFSNRISGGGFHWKNRSYTVVPNVQAEPFPIHGDGFQKEWTLSRGGATACLTLEDGDIGPWLYRAQQSFALTPDSLTITLSVTSKSKDPLPFGAGFHPWFPRDADTRLSFAADTVWLADTNHLPTAQIKLDDTSDWNFANARALPSRLIDNCYDGWRGVARIQQGRNAMSCFISGSDALRYAMVYSPQDSSGFFCFEPVSHPVDAFRLPGQPGLQKLVFGESLTVSMVLRWA